MDTCVLSEYIRALKSVKRFERSNGLDTALYKNYLYLFINKQILISVRNKPLLLWWLLPDKSDYIE